MNFAAKLKTCGIALTAITAFACAQAEYENAMAPTNALGFLLGNDPFDLAGTPEILVSGSTGVAFEGGRLQFQVNYSNNVAWTLNMNVTSSSPHVTFAGAQSTSVEFPFGTTGVSRSVFADIGPDANFTDDDFTLTFSSRAVPDAFLRVRSVDTDVAFSASAAHTDTTVADAFTARLVDLDGDGKPDLTVAASTRPVHIYRNTSNPGFASFAAFQSMVVDGGQFGSVTQSVGFHDMDGDGKVDLVAGNDSFSNSSIRILRNTSTLGNITFDIPGISQFVPDGLYASVTGDIDGDGLPDAVVLGRSGNVFVFRNTSTPGSISFAPSVSFDSNTFLAQQLHIGDLDGDGKPDLCIPVARNFLGQDQMVVFHNRSTPGTVDLDYTLGSSNDSGSGSIEETILSDVNGDGRPDILVLRDHLYVFRNVSVIGFPDFRRSRVSLDVKMNSMAAADFNSNGRTDVVLTNSDPGDARAIAILRNASSASSIIMRPPRYLLSPPTNGSRTTAGDVDGDGRPDFVYSVDGTPPRIYVHENITEN